MTAPMLTMSRGDQKNAPDHRDAAYIEQMPFWELCQDVKASTHRIRERKELYLPRFTSESAKDWDARVKMTFADNHYDQTLADHVGMVFSQDPVISDNLPVDLEPFIENVDGENSHFTVFAKQFFETALDYGHAAILVDYPRIPDGVRLNKDQARVMRLQPYWSIIRADQIVNKRSAIIGGTRVLTQVSIAEESEIPDGEFGVKYVTQYRVITQEITSSAVAAGMAPQPTGLGKITFKTWAPKADDAKQYMVIDEGEILGPSLIPLAICYGGPKLGLLRSRPHLVGMAYTSLEETQVKSDYANIMHKCNVPTPVFIGRGPQVDTGEKGSDEVVMGIGIDIPVGGDAKMLEPSGAALDATRTRIQDIRDQLRRQGAWLHTTTASMTATEYTQLARRTSARLLTASRSCKDALEAALTFTMEYMRLPITDDGVTVTMAKDFGTPTIDANILNAYTAIYNAGGLPLEALLHAAKYGELPDEFEPEQAAAEAMAAEAQRLEEERVIAEARMKEMQAAGGMKPPVPPGKKAPPASPIDDGDGA